jgi:hypothetical protein
VLSLIVGIERTMYQVHTTNIDTEIYQALNKARNRIEALGSELC